MGILQHNALGEQPGVFLLRAISAPRAIARAYRALVSPRRGSQPPTGVSVPGMDVGVAVFVGVVMAVGVLIAVGVCAAVAVPTAVGFGSGVCVAVGVGVRFAVGVRVES